MSVVVVNEHNTRNADYLWAYLADKSACALIRMDERIKSCQSLQCLLQALCNSKTTIDLRNEFTVVGTISRVDSRMK